MSSKIKSVHAREVLDSKGIPTVDVDVVLEDGSIGRASAPGSTSSGSNEALYLRDGDKRYFNGMGANKAIRNVNTEIAARLKGVDATDQGRVDKLMLELDGTENKSRLGGNATIATSLACAKAAAASRKVELFQHLGGGREIPLVQANLMFGGPAYVGVRGTADFQEYKLIALSAPNYKEGFFRILRIYEKLVEVVVKKRGIGIPRLASHGGALTAQFDSNDEALATLTELIEGDGFVPRKDFGLYLDIASTQLYKDGKYHLSADGQVLSREEWIERLVGMCERYPIVSMEDCLFEDDWDGWATLTKRLGKKVQLVGDDLFTTNPDRLRKGIKMGVANAVVIKPNQVGTLTETFETVRLAKEAGYGTVVSPRSGELYDPYIVHLCVGQSLGQAKALSCPTGGLYFNEFLRIADALGERAIYRGKEALARFL
jgi:enolase